MGDIGQPLKKIEFDPMYEPAPVEPAPLEAPVLEPIPA